MTDAAIISGSLVDVRNVGTHKSVKLTIHVPEEYAMKVVAAFGWPTGVNPISVAIARLDEKKLAGGEVVTQHAVNVPTAGSNPARSATKEKRPFADMPSAQQAGMLSDDRAFRLFLAEKFDMPVPSPDEAAAVIRHHCKVESRSNIKLGNPAAFAEWSALVLAYRLWQNSARYVEA